MATTHNDDVMGSDLPPPAYQLTDAEVDRKVVDAAQRSLNEPARPTLPPIDEDGFPLWDDALFEYNKSQREREREEQNSKLRSEYAPRPVASEPSAASSSSSPPQTPANVQAFVQAQPMRALSPVAQSKQKEEAPRWFENNNSGRIVQDDDPIPEMGGLNVGRPNAQYSHAPSQSIQQMQNQARPAIQVQVGPRPHDVLAQPRSPVSDPEDDPLFSTGGTNLGRAPTYRLMGHPRTAALPTPTSAGDTSELNRAPTYRSMTTGQVPNDEELDLGRAPTYRTVGQGHPGHGHAHVRSATDRAPVRSDSMMSNGSAELPAWTAHAPSLEGPAYEEVVGQASGRRSASGGSSGNRGGTREWQGIQARPQVLERVGAKRWSNTPVPYESGGGVPYGSSGAAAPPTQTRTPLPSPPPPAGPTPMVTTTYTPLRSMPGPGGFDVGAAYRASQQYSLGRSDTVSTTVEAQTVLRTAGANAFYP